MRRFNAEVITTVLILELAIRIMHASGLFLREAYLSQTNQSCSISTVASSKQGLHTAIPPPFRTLGTQPVMPRIRGRPRRGAAWYAAESRRKRKANFERALAIASRRRKLKLRAPPPVFIEEVIPPNGPPNPPEHISFTIPKNWNSRISHGSPVRYQPVDTGPDPSAVIEERPYTPCYVVEEVPPEATEATEDAEQERQLQQSKKESEGGNEENAASYSQEQPPAANWDLLNLIFDIRGKMEDHIFRLAQINQRLDMFFAAHSRAASKKQCPTCARTYTFPARWRHSEA
jgi:hypothetical protein